MDVISKRYNIKIDTSGTLPRISCPFHTDHTPSLFIYPKTSSFYCFSCNAGGNAANFVSLMENIPYKEALKLLNMPVNSNGTETFKDTEKYKQINLNFKKLVAKKCREILSKNPYIDFNKLYNLLVKIKYFEDTNDKFDVLKLRYKYFLIEISNIFKSKNFLKIKVPKNRC